MQVYRATGEPVHEGDIVTDQVGIQWTFVMLTSNGRVYCKSTRSETERRFEPSVLNLTVGQGEA